MEIQLVTMPELTFETGMVLNMGNGTGGVVGVGVGGGGRGMGREKKNKRSFVPFTEERRLIAPDSFWKSLLFQDSFLPQHFRGIAGFLLFVIFHCSLGSDSSKGFF